MDLLSKTYIAAQIFGLISTVLSIVSQQYKSRKVILVFFIFANLANSIHFLLLNAITGFIMALIGSVRFGVAIVSIKKYWLIVFLAINTIATYLFFEGYILSGTSYIAATCIILSSFLVKDSNMRIAIIFGALGWLIYSVLIGSIIGVVANMLFFSSSVTGWYRYRVITVK